MPDLLCSNTFYKLHVSVWNQVALTEPNKTLAFFGGEKQNIAAVYECHVRNWFNTY